MLSQENRLFLKRWFEKPFQMGTFAPISRALAYETGQYVQLFDTPYIIELGAGTGRITEFLIPFTKKLYLVEIDEKLCSFLKEKYPNVTVIQGDARHLEKILPEEVVGQAPLVVSSLPLMYFQKTLRQEIVDAIFRVLKEEGSLVHVTYSFISPLQNVKYKQRVKDLWLNFPPGFIWHYKK